jgi:hypothetical protein
MTAEKPEKSGIIRDKEGKFVPGHSGNPAGKPPGTISAIAKVKQIFQENPEEFEKFIEEYIKDPNNRKHIVEMIDGKPKQDVNLGNAELPFTIIVKKDDGGGKDNQGV